MAQKKFYQSVAFPVKNADGKEELVHFRTSHDGKPAVHEVSEEILKHPHFAGYEASGYIQDADGSPVGQETLVQRNHRIASQLAADSNKESKPEDESQAVDEAPGEEAQAHSADEDASQEVDARKSKKKR